VLLADGRGHQALHDGQPNDSGDASPTNHQDAINYNHRQRTISPFAYEIAGGTQDTSLGV
jgi:hypothetical protein